MLISMEALPQAPALCQALNTCNRSVRVSSEVTIMFSTWYMLTTQEILVGWSNERVSGSKKLPSSLSDPWPCFWGPYISPPVRLGERLGVSHINCSNSPRLCCTTACLLISSLSFLPKATVRNLNRSSAVLGPPASWHKARTLTPSPQEGDRCLPEHLLFMVHLLFEKIKLQCCINKTHAETQFFLKNQKHMHQNVNMAISRWWDTGWFYFLSFFFLYFPNLYFKNKCALFWNNKHLAYLSSVFDSRSGT